MKTLVQALAACPLIGCAVFRNYLLFLLPAETEFQTGHYGDWDYVRTECVPGDAGGRTRYGIDQASHPLVDVDSLTLAQACQIYLSGDWLAVRADLLPPDYGTVLVDIHVNGGNGPLMLQEGLNDLGAGLTEDGWLGPKSRAAMAKYGTEGVHAFLNRRDGYYQYLAAHHPNDRQFLDGWLNRDEALAGWLDHNNALRVHLALPAPSPAAAPV